MARKRSGKELSLSQIHQLTQSVSCSYPDTIYALVQRAIDAISSEEGLFQSSLRSDIQTSIKNNPSLLNLICALGPRDVAEVMLISQFVVLHMKGMKNFHADYDQMGMEFLKLSQETFQLLNRYRGKASSQNINVTYNIISDKAQINAIR
jgi:hypothetical protein